METYRRNFPGLIISLCLIVSGFTARSQCPANIDFELGNFTGWQCWVGHTFVSGVTNTIVWDGPGLPVPPDPNRHEMLSSYPGNGRDAFGDFPKNCPNGSGHSIKLGNTTGGHEAEGVSYTFTIPPTQNQFSLIYYYAVVFQGPVHEDWQQPRLVIEISNLTDNTILNCSSFNFFYSTNSPTLPGFFLSQNNNTGTPVWCKDWAANSINLDGNAGKTIQLFFKTADCTFNAHFGYAYVDVNTECSSSFTGATFCPDDTLVNVTAPFGYQNYKWFDINNNVLGTQQVLTLNPPPLSGDSVFVELTPYSGFGCLDTLTAHLWDTLTVYADAGRDTLFCAGNTVQLGGPPKPGLVYHWLPITGLSDPNISNPIATVTISTAYILTVTNNGGGCITKDTVQVSIPVLNDSLQLIGSARYCTATGLTTILKVFPADSIQWYRNSIAIPGATQTTYIVTQNGIYYAEIISFAGCSINTRLQQVDIFESPVAGFNVDTVAQCFSGNQFSFTNTSSISTGILQYNWDMGDGNFVTTRDVIYNYAQAGSYIVKLLVSTADGCADSVSTNINVYPQPVAGFTVNKSSLCFKNHRFVFTNTSTVLSGNLFYSWDMGDGTLFTTRDITYSYAVPGTYTVKLVVKADNGNCFDSSSFIVTVYPSPFAGFTINKVNQCIPNHQFIFSNTSSVFSGALQYRWELGDGAIDTAKDITHIYAQPGIYKVNLLVTADGGCTDSSSFTVSVYPVATAGFIVNPVCVNIRVPLINTTKEVPGTTINYLWDFGNGQSSVARTPVYIYSIPGTYTIKLHVSTTQCPLDINTMQSVVTIDAQASGINYPVRNLISFFPEVLDARRIGNSVLWVPGTSLDNRNSYTPTYRGQGDQLYTIQLRTPTGCLTVDTQLVKTRKNIKIYVPNIFTPGNSDGINDLLRPLLMSFIKVNYFRIYNRWGKLLFEMKSDRPGWDGRINGELAEVQTLIWMIEAVDVDGIVHREHGTTILMR